jgi:hypothetical protein
MNALLHVDLLCQLCRPNSAVSFHYAGRLIKRFGEFRLMAAGTLYGESINLLAMLLLGVGSPLLMNTGSLLFGVSMVAKDGLMQCNLIVIMQRANADSGEVGKLFDGVHNQWCELKWS